MELGTRSASACGSWHVSSRHVNYATFLEQKKRVFLGDGLRATTADLPAVLYDWQAAVTRWALKKGRAAIFADCGLGKTTCRAHGCRR